jgi:LPS export ABC transporter permease LptG
VRKVGIRPGLIDAYLMRGAFGPFVLVTLFLVAAMMLERSLRLIQEMAAAGADIRYLGPLLLQLAPYYLELAIPAGFMVALVLLVARLDDRLEIEAMLAMGLSMSRIVAPLVALGVVIGGCSLYAGGWLAPHGRYAFRATRLEAINAGRLTQLEPRAIHQPAERLALTFDRRASAGRVEGIFVWQRLDDGSELVLTAPSAEIGFIPRFRSVGMNLFDGLYLGNRGGNARPVRLSFDRLHFRASLRLEDTGWDRGWDQNEMTLPELAAARRSGSARVADRALATELFARLARALAIPLIPMLVLPLAFATKRGRRGIGIFVGAVVLMLFHHALILAKRLAYGGEIAPAPAVFGALAIYALVVLLLFVAGRHLPSHSPVSSALRSIGSAMARLRPSGSRRPSLSGRTFASYLAVELAKWTAMTLLGIVVLLQLLDLLDRGAQFAARDMGAGDMLHYMLLRLAPIAQQALPVAALGGAMITFVGLSRSFEMTAIRAAGISQWRILIMALPVPLALAAATLFLAERASPVSQLRFASWWNSTAANAAAAEPQSRWFRLGGEIVRAGAQSEGGRRLDDVEIFRRDGTGRLRERVTAATAALHDGQWTLSNVETRRVDADPVESTAAASIIWTTVLRPDDVTAFFTSARALSSAAARRALDISAPVNQAEALFSTRLYRAAAEPLAPILMLLLAFPLAFVSPRVGTSWPAFLYAGGGGLLYMVADGVLTVAGQVGYLPAAVGAWAAPAIVALGGVTVLLYAER